MSRADAAQNVREELKRRGINSRRVSVRSDYNSLQISIKDLSICCDEIEQIARKHEKIDYCPISQEILSGGNFFVSVSYSWEAEKKAKTDPAYIDLHEKISQKLNTLSGNTGVEILPGFVCFLSQNGHSIQATIEWDQSSYWHHFAGADDVAMALYRYIAQGKVKNTTL
jgi:hypothetical protein